MLMYWYQYTFCLTLCVGQKDIFAFATVFRLGLFFAGVPYGVASCLLPQVQKVVYFSTARDMSQHGAFVAWVGRKAMEN